MPQLIAGDEYVPYAEVVLASSCMDSYEAENNFEAAEKTVVRTFAKNS
jgi:hypothetical protein